MLGDFNDTINNNIDRSIQSKKKKMNNGKLPKKFFRLVENEGLIDIWRKRNQVSRDYTFYSNRHKTWSRINMIWSTKKLELLTNKIDIVPKIISDHITIQ